MDETFIKMCKEATEIQEGWEPRPADKVVLVRLDDNPYDLKGSYHLDHLDKDAKDWSNEDLHNEGIYWLPRQEDLQKIVLTKKWHDVDRLLDEFMCGWNMPTGQFNDLTTLWLCFVMETCYNKQWNGKTWVKTE